MAVLGGVEPARVMRFFEEISGIQRGSGHEKPISDYLTKFAKARGYEVVQDELWNILIKVPGVCGGEDAEPVILHGHMDMQWKKTEQSSHDFFKDQLQLYIEDGFIHAKETTLGADNGIGVAYMLALADSDNIPHPPLEIVLTVMEETGKKGAAAYNTSLLSAKKMLDFNWIDDRILAGCTGDTSLRVSFPAIKEPAPPKTIFLRIVMDGLKGGHSDLNINEGRANAIIQTARVIDRLRSEFYIRVADIKAGDRIGLIPSEAEAVLCVKESEKAAVELKIAELAEMLSKEYDVSDPEISLRVEKVEGADPRQVLEDGVLNGLLQTILLIPHGAITLNMHVPGQIETSNNLSVLATEENECWMMTTLTGALFSRKHDVIYRIKNLASLAHQGAKVEMFGVDAPEFPYNPDSSMLAMARKAFREARGFEGEVHISNFSLELGFFIRANGLDCVSIGTLIPDIHTPDERLCVESAQNTWKTIVVLMRDLCSVKAR
ncbi:MAG: beta-Ala-His dipeptidase [Oscillospiraceae bacterium]|nr:beta-Ala-His dipeptidase [Oscillospiraceae bacterium]